jgi:hypothetical protein
MKTARITTKPNHGEAREGRKKKKPTKEKIIAVLNPATELSCLFFTECKKNMYVVQIWLYEHIVIRPQTTE